jgi:hypothetical protein
MICPLAKTSGLLFMVDRGNFGYFFRSLNNKSHGYSIVEDPTNLAPVKMVEVFEVRPGDCGKQSDWNDCETDRERSELSGKGNNYSGDEYWYGWSIYFPEDYPNVYPTKTALGQFHQKNSHPVWMFENSDGGYNLEDQVRHVEYKLIDERELRGKWHRIEVQVKWSLSKEGYLRVWVNGVQKADYSGPTMTVREIYFKYGVYRSFVSRYKDKFDVDQVPTQKIYYANVRRGNSRKSLQSPSSLLRL